MENIDSNFLVRSSVLQFCPDSLEGPHGFDPTQRFKAMDRLQYRPDDEPKEVSSANHSGVFAIATSALGALNLDSKEVAQLWQACCVDEGSLADDLLSYACHLRLFKETVRTPEQLLLEKNRAFGLWKSIYNIKPVNPLTLISWQKIIGQLGSVLLLPFRFTLILNDS